MATVIAKLEIELSVEVDDDLDEDAQIEAAVDIFDNFRIKEYPHAHNATMVGLEHPNGTPVSDGNVRWSIPEYIDSEALRVE
jgi:hypothetical protein